MNKRLRHKIIGIALAGVFALFNIGLPVVVASCPMMKLENSRTCIMCNDGSSQGTSISRAIDTSCCLTVFAADRNTTEFLQVDKHFLEYAKILLAATPELVPATVIRNPQSVIAPGASPPITSDIPILVSSLLI